MRIKLYLSIILVFGICSCSLKEEFGNKALMSEIQEVEWNNLISNPVNYHNDTILIRGKYKTYFENSTIINQDSLGIWIQPADWAEIEFREYENLINKNILVIGQFNSVDKGHLSQHLGTITEIYYLKKE